MEKLTPEKAVEILKQHGTIVTVTQAQLILDFLYDLAQIAVTQYLREEGNDILTETVN